MIWIIFISLLGIGLALISPLVIPQFLDKYILLVFLLFFTFLMDQYILEENYKKSLIKMIISGITCSFIIFIGGILGIELYLAVFVVLFIENYNNFNKMLQKLLPKT